VSEVLRIADVTKPKLAIFDVRLGDRRGIEGAALYAIASVCPPYV
jgi:hypothetical protein